MSAARADALLAELGFFESRAKAREAIEAGLVSVDGRIVEKPSAKISAEAQIVARPAYPWVSRGGVKLAHALEIFGVDPSGAYCLDVGASTGGFTDVLLTQGARHVVAVDVGHGQLHERLLRDARVTSREGLDARALTQAHVDEAPQIVVCDASFISLRLVLPAALALAAPGAALIALIKPQFEAGRMGTKKGVVRDPAIHAQVCAGAETEIASLGWRVIDVAPSPIDGGDGNREFLLYARAP
jgi:23S rRNA (cytidine1920-2'-O)/16S rRNA (cytidine1409-2'-O)-methyltransferase